MNTTNSRMFLVPLLLGLLVACSGSDDGNGTLNIAITDAPVDDVSAVVVQFSGVSLKPASGPPIDFDFDTPESIDLYTLTNGATDTLLNESLPPGQYQWVRLNVDASFDNVFDSYVMSNGLQIELQVPSGSQTGLQLVHGFTITANQTTSFVIDWDLRKALTDPPGQPGMFLRPALRITDMTQFGGLSGTVIDATLMDATCTNDLGLDTGNAVYLYEGPDAVSDDIGSAAEPLVTANVQLQGAVYSYLISYLSPGDYTAVFTCQASDDQADTDDDIVFVGTQNVTIVDGEDATANF